MVDKILALPRLQAFADDKVKVTQKLEFVLERLEYIFGKAGYQHFLLFLQFFQKPSSTGLLKGWIVW